MDIFGDFLTTILNIVAPILELFFDNFLIVIKIFFFIIWKLGFFSYKVYLLIVKYWAICSPIIFGLVWKFFFLRFIISWRSVSPNPTITGISRYEWRRDDFKKRYSKSGQKVYDDVLFDPEKLTRFMRNAKELSAIRVWLRLKSYCNKK